MNQFFKNSIVLLLFIFLGGSAMAQKFTTHAVKKGETLEGISKQYEVSPNTILTYNKEIKRGEAIKENTILVIPIAAGVPGDTVRPQGEKPVALFEKAEPVQEKPMGFTVHKVRKRETLYGISQRYHITEDDLKRYNSELYSSQLKKGMRLKIPKYKRVDPEEGSTFNEEDFEIYTVAPKETRWSIANKFGITIDSMVVLNPGLSKTTDYLASGQELRMPKLPGSTIEDQETQLFQSYTVPPKMNFYRLEKQFNVKSDEIVRLNPEIAERGGLKEGMVIRIPVQKIDPGEVNTDNYIFYEVKPKQTEFSLTRKLGVTYKELLALNPDLKEGLKAGMVLKLPKDHTGNFEVRNSLVLDKIDLLDSINTLNRPKLMFLLPFRLDRLDLKDKEGVKETIEGRNSLKYSLGLYSGALMAIDSVAKLGVSVDVKTFDNQLDLAKTKEILLKENLADVSAIVGPLDLPSLKEVAVRASTYNVPVIAPIPANSDLSLGNVYFSYTSDEVLRERMLSFVEEKLTNENIIIIADEKSKEAKALILRKFPNAKVLGVIEEKENIGINRDKLASLLSEEVENWVFVETENFKLTSSVVSILNAFEGSFLDSETSEEKVKVRMFTTNKNKAFDNDIISSTHLSNLHFTYPSVHREVENNAFVKSYSKRFGDVPDRYAVRGFDLTYDLLLKLAYKNDLMDVSKIIGETEYTGNKFSYEKDLNSGYFNQASYIMAIDSLRVIQANK
ncbi:PBP1 and LysM peptidoglycan-binding domain-containing protein [Maribacter polysaccharolyticus]|uniref:PBP1 and LysM peptidoglycan-binding domain-containing protein n=1 Tax=Maribacter polysaccharolyticus TaxID=3020831 RepID=UPI00237F7777|nr:LysM peptidoglycan-binding domain-containing protein [Maribacter polysaccharolyticus]MDE3741348.1 LysM peptidoglycan-binding domain-containing protein [Maribacter polysaccharolyticus]